MTSSTSTEVPIAKGTARAARVVIALAFALNLWWVTRSWSEPLHDAHEFRQFQTAISTYYLHRDGLRLDYETPLLGPPWSIPMEFPTYQATVAIFSKATGMRLEQSARLIGILMFYAGLPALFLILRQWGVPWVLAAAAVAATLTSPIYAFYPRTFLIETTALSLSLWFLWGFQRGLAGDRLLGTLVAVLGGSLAILTKITTFAVFCVPALWLGLAAAAQRRSAGGSMGAVARVLAWCAGVAGVIVAVGIAWVAFADKLKAANPYADFLISDSLNAWNFGTWSQRIQPEFWREIYRLTAQNIVGEPALLLLAAGAFMLNRATRVVLLVLLAAGFSGFLTFSNLYFVHDYYHCANAIFFTSAFGLVAGAVLMDERLPRMVRFILVGGTLIVAQGALFYRGYGGFHSQHRGPPMMFAEIVRRTTGPEDIVAAFGLDWNGELPYYSERRAIMVPHHRIDDGEAFTRSVMSLGLRRVGAVVFAGSLKSSPHFVQPRIELLDLEAEPIAETNNMALYLRKDLHERALGILRGNNYPGVRFNLVRAAPPAGGKDEHDLDTPEWRARLAAVFEPLPAVFRSVFAPAMSELEGKPILGTHAPNEISIRVPAGARHVRALGGLVPDAYANGHMTDGVVLQVINELPHGERRVLLERTVVPGERVEDRGDQLLKFDSESPLRGSIVLRVDPGPSQSVNFDWAYWRSVRIY